MNGQAADDGQDQFPSQMEKAQTPGREAVKVMEAHQLHDPAKRR